MQRTAISALIYFSSDFVTDRMCENRGDIELSCSVGHVIEIRNAFYGRLLPDSKACPYGRPHRDDTHCRAPRSEEKIIEKCEGQKYCSIPSTNKYFGDPCYGTYKYVEVSYRCAPIGKQWMLLHDSFRGHMCHLLARKSIVHAHHAFWQGKYIVSSDRSNKWCLLTGEIHDTFKQGKLMVLTISYNYQHRSNHCPITEHLL